MIEDMKRIALMICLSLVAVCSAVAQGDGERNVSLRANLLRWATLTPNVGLEVNGGGRWSVIADGSWTHWSWDGKARHYALWETSIEMRRYLCDQKRAYLGAMAKIGQFNYKLSSTGRQGDIVGGGLTCGYKLPLGKRFDLDFSIGAGYLYVIDLERYGVVNGVRVYEGKRDKGYWGVTNLGVSLSYEL